MVFLVMVMVVIVILVDDGAFLNERIFNIYEKLHSVFLSILVLIIRIHV
jgi:hypothetical protein